MKFIGWMRGSIGILAWGMIGVQVQAQPLPASPAPPLTEARGRQILEAACTPKGNFLSKSTFSGPSIRGRVVDMDTDVPLPGVVVFAHWGAHLSDAHEAGRIAATVHAVEVVTDQQGRFEIPAWGPLTMISDWEDEKRGYDKIRQMNLPSLSEQLGASREFRAYREPFITLFKSGYSSLQSHPFDESIEYLQANPAPRPGKAPAVLAKSAYEGRTFKLHRPTDAYLYSNQDRFAVVYDALQVALANLLKRDPCAWQRFPQSICYAHQYRTELGLAQYGQFALARCDAVWQAAGCPSFQQFLRENAK